MNMCIHGTIASGVKTLRARVEHNMARGASEFCSAWKLTDAGNKEFMACMNVTDMEAMGAFMSSPEELQWDKDNGCEYTVYGLEEMTE